MTITQPKTRRAGKVPPGTRGFAATPPRSLVQAIVRTRLAAAVPPEEFEAWLRSRPAVRGAWALSGDHDYEVRLTCPSLRDLTAELRLMRQHGGAEETDTCLLLHDVFGK